jgi:hypothetical protein
MNPLAAIPQNATRPAIPNQALRKFYENFNLARIVPSSAG